MLTKDAYGVWVECRHHKRGGIVNTVRIRDIVREGRVVGRRQCHIVVVDNACKSAIQMKKDRRLVNEH